MDFRTLSFDDLLQQLDAFRTKESINELFERSPGMSCCNLDLSLPEAELTQLQGIIHSLTPAERRRPERIDDSRFERIASGAGVACRDIRSIVHRFLQVREMMRKMSRLL